MPDRELPARPNLEQYKKQAKELGARCSAGRCGCTGAHRATSSAIRGRRAVRGSP